MKGYTIQNSIELLEKAVENGSGSGGASTAADVSYDNTSSHLTADDVQEAIDEINAKIPPAVEYSTTEHVIGKWLDGSILYEKTIDTGEIPNYQDKSVAHGISNLGNVVGISGVANNPTSGYFAPLPYVQNDVTYQIAIYVDDTNIHVVTGRDMSAYSVSYVTLRYTKAVTEAKTTRKKSSK